MHVQLIGYPLTLGVSVHGCVCGDLSRLHHTSRLLAKVKSPGPLGTMQNNFFNE